MAARGGAATRRRNIHAAPRGETCGGAAGDVVWKAAAKPGPQALKRNVARLEEWDAALDDAGAALEGLAEARGDAADAEFYAEAADEALAALRASLDAYEVDRALDGPYDACACRLEIASGAGGLDAQDWTAMLARMSALRRPPCRVATPRAPA